MDNESFAKRRMDFFARMENNSVAFFENPPRQYRNHDAHFPYRPSSDFYYLTGFREENARAVFSKKGGKTEWTLYVQELSAVEQAFMGKAIGPEGAVDVYRADHAFGRSEFNAHLADHLSGAEHIYLAVGNMPEIEAACARLCHQYRLNGRRGKLTPQHIINSDTLLHEMRLFKDAYELECIKRACEVAASGHFRMMQATLPGRTEYELEAEFLYEVLRSGCRATAYETIVATGANACVLHYTNNNCKCHEGELVLIDAGAEYEYYASDITRTFPVNGVFTARQRDLYEVVLHAQKAVIASIKPGLSWQRLQETAISHLTQGLLDLSLLQGSLEENIEQKTYHRFYMHGVSHLLGLDVHDVGAYKQGDEWRVLEPGMVFTVEPGLYIHSDAEDIDGAWRGMGIRIEDDVLVTAEGAEVLTAILPKEIQQIESLMQHE